MNDKKALEIFEACINEMYLNSVPPVAWRSILKSNPKEFFSKHKITEEKYEEIKAKYEKKLPNPKQYYKRQLDWFLLDYAPSFKEEMK
jgi:hypothetical protein